MRTYNTNFSEVNRATAKEPRLVVEVSFDFANTDLYYFTSHPDAALPSGASSVSGSVAKVTSTSQKLNPIEGRSTIGTINVTLADLSASVTSVISNKLGSGNGLRGKRLRVYVGFKDTAWADYELVQTQIIDQVEFAKGGYTIRCADVQRSARKDIFDLAATNLTATVSATDTTIPVKSTAGFEALAHGASYSDAPNIEVLYFKIGDEIIRCPVSGIQANQFTGVSRGVLGTKPVEHKVDTTVDDDRKPKVEEVVYLEMPAVKLALAILTGDLYNQAGKKLPSKWHLGIDPQYIRTSDFTGIGTDWWDPNDDTQGVIVRFIGEKKQDAKRFIEQQINRLLGAFNPIYSDGSLGLKRMTVVISDAAHVRELNEDNVVSYSALRHDMRQVHNQFQIDWNWDPVTERFTRSLLRTDAASISKHGAAPLLTLKYRGLYGSRWTDQMLAQRIDTLRSRHAGPPLLITLNVLPSLNDLEVGDIVRVRLDNVRDYTGGTTSIDRAFEVQGITTDWVTGNLRLDLFGSAEKAGAIALSTATTALSPSFYTSAGTELKSYLDTNYPGAFSIVGGVGHIVADCTLPGGADVNASGSIYYYDAPLQIDSGVTVTITDNVQLRVNGHLQIDGKVDGSGRGLPGVSTPEAGGTAGFIGSTQAGGGWTKDQEGGYGDIKSIEAVVTQGKNATFPDLTIINNGTSLRGIPSDLRGTSGGGGHNGYVYESLRENLLDFSLSGGAGGAGGAGLLVVSHSAEFGQTGNVDLSGGDGLPGQYAGSASGLYPSMYAGSGAGGAPGALLFLLDGNTSVVPSNKLTANQGQTPVTGTRLKYPVPHRLSPGDPDYNPPYYSYYTGINGNDRSLSNFHWQYLPENLTPQPDVPETTSVPTAINVTEIQNQPPTPAENLATLEVSVTPPSDGNYSHSNIYYRIVGQVPWTLVGPTSPEAVIVVPMDGTQYEISARPVSIFGVESKEYITTIYTVATAKGGVVLQPGNYIRTSPTVGQTTNGEGVEVTEQGIKGYDTAGNLKFSLDAATGLITAIDGSFTGTVTATAGQIGGWTITANSITKANVTLDAANSRIQAGPDNSSYARLDQNGITATLGLIGGWSITQNSISKGNVTLDAANSRIQAGPDASTYVRMDASGITGVDAILGTTFRIPTDGSPPLFASGKIQNTVYEISTSGILRTSPTVGDGSANSQGVLINDTGIKVFAQNASVPGVHIDATTGKININNWKTDVSGSGIPEENATYTYPGNMFVNGSAQLGDNTNFSLFTYDPVGYRSPGSFKYTNGETTAQSDFFIPIDPNSDYEIQAALKGQNANTQAYIGLAFYDRNKQFIDIHECWRDPSRDTTLYAAANAGQNYVDIVPPPVDWYQVASPYSYIQWDVKPDASDQPQQNARRITNIDKTPGIYWRLTLSGTVPQNYPAGTPVGNSTSGSTFTYVLTPTGAIGTDWMVMRERLKRANNGFSMPDSKTIRRGAAYAKLVVFTNSATPNDFVWLDDIRMVPIQDESILNALALANGPAQAGADATQPTLEAGVTITAGGITLSSGGAVKGGQTDYNAGIGFFLGYSGSQYKLSIGNPNGGHMLWDGSNLTTRSATTGKRIEINPGGDNEIHFWGDRGDGTVEELANIGIQTVGTDYVIGWFGRSTAGHTNIGVRAESYGNIGLYAKSINAQAGWFYSVNSAAVRAISDNNYAGIFSIGALSGLAHLYLLPAKTSGRITHAAAAGSIFMNLRSDAYVNRGGYWDLLASQNLVILNGTTGSLANGSYVDVNISNTLVDLQDQTVFVIAKTDSGNPRSWVATCKLADGKVIEYSGNNLNAPSIPSTPSSGARVRFYNYSGGTSTITYRIMLMGR